MMALTIVENDARTLRVHRLNTPYIADIKSGIAAWLGSWIFFGVFDLLTIGLSRWVGSNQIQPFLSAGLFLLWESLLALAVAANLIPDFIGLLSPREFIFDKDRNAFSVEGNKVGFLDTLSIRLQDAFGPSRRAFRIVLSIRGRNYVIAQTQRFTMATFAHKEYTDDAVTEGLQRRYWFNQWADYRGEKTGFSMDWPEYKEIFALYEKLKQFRKAPPMGASSPNPHTGGKDKP
jgi:hypothetical protein